MLLNGACQTTVPSLWLQHQWGGGEVRCAGPSVPAQGGITPVCTGWVVCVKKRTLLKSTPFFHHPCSSGTASTHHTPGTAVCALCALQGCALAMSLQRCCSKPSGDQAGGFEPFHYLPLHRVFRKPERDCARNRPHQPPLPVRNAACLPACT